MDIPDEVIEQAIDAAYSAVDGTEPAGTWGDVRMTVEAAAPHIARAAQVAVLRQLECRFVRISENWTLLGDLARASVYGVEGSYLRGKLDELEAGAGQAGGVRDGA